MDQVVMHNGLPVEQGLYDPRNEKDACGMGFIVNLNGENPTRSSARAFRS